MTYFARVDRARVDRAFLTAVAHSGNLFGISAGIETQSQVNVLMGKLQPGAAVRIPTVPGGTFVYTLVGALQFNNGDATIAEHMLAIVASGSDHIALHNAGAAPARFLFGNGARIDEPWVKLLTHNGFFLCRDEDEARRQERILQTVGLDAYGSQPE